MQNLFIQAISWQYTQPMMLFIAYCVLLTAFIIRNRAFKHSINKLSEQLEESESAYLQLSESIELLRTDYREIPEEISPLQSPHHIREYSCDRDWSCWHSVLEVTGGDQSIAFDLGILLVEELPVIMNQLEDMNAMDDEEYSLIHQWNGLFRTCGANKLADYFEASIRQIKQTDGILGRDTRENMTQALQLIFVETARQIVKYPDMNLTTGVNQKSVCS